MTWTAEQRRNAMLNGVCRFCGEPFERVTFHNGEELVSLDLMMETERT